MTSLNSHAPDPHPATLFATCPPSGIYRLPNELTSLILVAVVTCPRSMWTGLDQPDQLDGNTIKFPVIAQLVCRRWKAIALMTPGLWTTLNLTSGSEGTLSRYLKTSGNLPLEVYSEPSTSPDMFNPGLPIQRAALLLSKHAHRVQKLHVNRCGLNQLDSLLPDLDNLVELTMLIRASTIRDMYLTTVLKLPRLRSLRLHEYSLGHATMHVSPSLEELRVIAPGARHWLSNGKFVVALQAFPNLRVLELGRQPLMERPAGDQQASIGHTVILDRLEQLALWGYTNGQLRQILDLVQARNLRNLIIRKHIESTSSDTGSILVLGFPVLKRLEVDASSTLCLEIAEQASSIKHLTFFHDHKGITLECIDNRFNSLALHWRSLPHALPLETLETCGVLVSSLLSLLGEDRLKVVPLLHKVSVHYTDAFRLGDGEHIERQRTEWKTLIGLVPASVHGIRTDRR